VHEQIRQNRRRDGRVRSFSDAHKRPEGNESPEGVHVGADECRGAPEGDAERHDRLAREPITEVAEDRREDHVADDEDRLQETAVIVLDVERFLNVGENTWNGRVD
jgi:hypothetical protein